MSEAFIGEIRMFAGNFAPVGWAFCDGQLLAIAQYDALFSLLGTTYGGDGQATFALPDLRDRVPIHYGQGSGLSNRALGEQGGTETVTLTVAQMPAHTHSARGTTALADAQAITGALPATTPEAPSYASAAPSVAMNTSSFAAVGGSQPHTNVPPYQGVSFIIALEGIYPSRA